MFRHKGQNHHKSCEILYIGDCTLLWSFYYFEVEGENKDQFCFDFISVCLKIEIELSLAVGDAQDTFWFFFMAQSNFQNKVEGGASSAWEGQQQNFYYHLK